MYIHCTLYLCTCNVLQIAPVHMGTTVVISMDQLVCEGVIHVPLRVDIVFTQNDLSLLGIKPSSYCGATGLTHKVTIHIHLTVEG